MMAQDSAPKPEPSRRVVTRVTPVYPALARKMHVQGIVRVQAVVRPNGVVKSTRVVGGNPVFVDAASDAVKLWKFESAANETTEVVVVAFEDHDRDR